MSAVKSITSPMKFLLQRDLLANLGALLEPYGPNAHLICDPFIAQLVKDKTAASFGPGTHGSTFGGNPVVCAGANVVVDRMDQSFLANVNERAVQLRAGIAKLPHVKSISGIGLMVGIEFYDLKAADVLAACREAGLLVLTAKTRLRLLPPLTLSEHDVDMALEILSDVLGKMEPTAPKEQA